MRAESTMALLDEYPRTSPDPIFAQASAVEIKTRFSIEVEQFTSLSQLTNATSFSPISCIRYYTKRHDHIRREHHVSRFVVIHTRPSIYTSSQHSTTEARDERNGKEYLDLEAERL